MEQMDASELHARRLNAKEVLTPMKGDNFIFPVADGTVKTPGGNRRLKPSNPSLRWLNTGRCGSPKWFLVYYGRFHLSPSRGTQSQTVHAERRIISCSNEVHRRYQNNTYVTRCIVGKTYWWLLERRWRKRIIRCMDRHHKIHFIERKATWRICMVWGETYEETNNYKTRQCMARYVEAYVWCSEK